MSRFAPVHLPEPLGDRASMTFLRHYSMCPRSGYLSRLTRDALHTAEMERGRAVHAINERAIRTAMENGEVTIPPEIVKVIADEVLAEFHVPFEEHDYCREAAYRFASEWIFDPSKVVALETLFSLDVDGFAVRCRIDYAEIAEDGAAVVVKDWKSARGAPSFEDIARKLPDGRLAAKSFQLVLYALALAFGVPVRVEECGLCRGGRDQAALAMAGEFVDAGQAPECPACEGRGRVEIPEPFPVASRAARFDLEFVYPGIEDREGRMVRRPVTLTRPELDQYLQSLKGLVERVRASEETGDWPAVVSDQACAECPASALCPIPAELRDHRGAVNTPEEAAEAFEVRHREKKIAAAKSKELRAFVKAHGPVRYGNGMVAEIGYSASERISDKEGFMDAVERTARYGEPLERHRFVKTVESFPLVERELSADELAEEVDDGNGRDGAGDPEQQRDERWGDRAPW